MEAFKKKCKKHAIRLACIVTTIVALIILIFKGLLPEHLIENVEFLFLFVFTFTFILFDNMQELDDETNA